MERFGNSLAYAAVAALASVVWVLLTAPWLGASDSRVFFALATLALYPVVIAPDRRRAVLALLAGGGLAVAALGVGLATGSASAAVVSGGVAMALVRSGWLYRRRPLRAAVLEGALLLGGGFVAHLLGGGLLGNGLAIWGFFLVQSLYFLAGDTAERPAANTGDPFDSARSRLEELLDEVPVG